VGIGTTNPSFNLEVSGTSALGTGGGGGGVLLLKPGTGDNTYIGFYARTSSPTVRSGLLGYTSAGSADLRIMNESSAGALVFFTNDGTSVDNRWQIGATGHITPFGNVYDIGGSVTYNRVRKIWATDADFSGNGIFSGNVGIGTSSPTYKLEVAGTGRFSGQLTLSSGLLFNNATSNLVNYGTAGVGAPAFTSRSAGTKLVLWDSLSGSEVDYGLGIDASTLWFSINVVNNSFKWYGGTTLLMRLSRGNLVVGNGTGQLANAATDGFLYIASMNGAPSGTPTAYTGSVPLVYDTTNNQLYVYNGAWKKVALT